MHSALWSPGQAGAELEPPLLSQVGEGTVQFTSPSSALGNFVLELVGSCGPGLSKNSLIY